MLQSIQQLNHAHDQDLQLYVNKYAVTSHGPCSNALKLLEILISAVVTMVVSRAERNKQSQSAAMIVFNLILLILGTTDVDVVVGSFPVVVFSFSAIKGT